MSTININKKASVAFLVVGLGILLLVSYADELFPNDGNNGGGDENPCPDILQVENITVQVNYINGTTEMKVDLAIDNGTFTVFALMDREFTISYDVYPNGYYIKKINGAGTSWTYKVDSVPIGIASNKQCLSNNSVIEWNQL